MLLACAGPADAGVFEFFYETDPMRSKKLECNYAKTRAKVSADIRCAVVKQTGKKQKIATAKLFLGDGNNEIELLLWCE